MSNISDIHSEMYGVVKGYKICNLDRTSELDERIYERNIPSTQLQPNFSMRPVSTKYDLLGVMDRRAQATVPIQTFPTYKVSYMFNPGTSKAPFSGFATNINTESSLRNQFFALQKSDKTAYVPNSNSDMYHNDVAASSNTMPNQFHHLQRQDVFAPFNPNSCNLGKGIFMNHTRQQLKDL